MQGEGLGVWGWGLGTSGLGFGAWCAGHGVRGLGLGFAGFRFEVLECVLGFRVRGLELRISGVGRGV